MTKSEDKFWQVASTIMALIRDGHTSARELGEIIGKPHSTTHCLVHRLISLGLVAHTPRKCGTLRLVDPDAVSLIRLACDRPDGVLEKLPARNGGAR